MSSRGVLDPFNAPDPGSIGAEDEGVVIPSENAQSPSQGALTPGDDAPVDADTQARTSVRPSAVPRRKGCGCGCATALLIVFIGFWLFCTFLSIVLPFVITEF